MRHLTNQRWSPSSDGSSGEDQLPCGASVDRLLAQVAEGLPSRDPEHQRRCPHCRAALAELREIWAPVDDLVAEDVTAPAGLLQAVMARVRELSRNAWYAVLHEPEGEIRIAARVVGAVTRIAAESVPHVNLALGRGRAATLPHALPGVTRRQGKSETSTSGVGVAGTHVVIDVQIAVDYGAPIQEVARQVRERIDRDLHKQAGLTTTEVNITVVDVHPTGSGLPNVVTTDVVDGRRGGLVT